MDEGRAMASAIALFFVQKCSFDGVWARIVHKSMAFTELT
jgi:hypothetical protein